MKTRLLLITFAVLSLSACKRKDWRLADRLVGTWDVKQYLVTSIDTAGNVTTLLDQADAGTYEFKIAESGGMELEGQIEYTKNLMLAGRPMVGQGVGKFDEEGKRVIFYGGSCIGCDTFYTIDEGSRRVQVWSRYFQIPEATLKTQIHLKRQ